MFSPLWNFLEAHDLLCRIDTGPAGNLFRNQMLKESAAHLVLKQKVQFELADISTNLLDIGSLVLCKRLVHKFMSHRVVDAE